MAGSMTTFRFRQGLMRLNARIALGVLAALLVLPCAAAAQEPDTFVRLYYSSWMEGKVRESPADPTGRFTEDATLSQNPLAGLEVIFLRRLGLSFVRQKMERTFEDETGLVAGCAAPPCTIDERTVEQSLNLTLYAREMAHNQFNLFLGGGAGELDTTYRVDGILQTHGELYDNLSLARWFAGLEFTFERIGFRLEWSRVEADKTLPDATPSSAGVEETFQYLTLVIPLN